MTGLKGAQINGLSRSDRRAEILAAKKRAQNAEVATSVATNTANIATNTANIASNAADIGFLEEDVEGLPYIQHGVKTVPISSGVGYLAFTNAFPVWTSPTVVLTPSSGNEVTVVVESVTRFGVTINYYQGGSPISSAGRSIHWMAMVTE